MVKADPPLINSPEAFAAQFPVSRETLDRLKTYEALLKRWQKTINLVAPSTLDQIWHRHFADSAQVYFASIPAIPAALQGEGKPPIAYLDIGSGAGFPGLVIAILAAEHGGTRHTLIESDSRKAAFLREVARNTGVVVDILCTRIENNENQAKVREVNCITARALAPLPRLIELAYPYLGPDTIGLFLKGRDVAAEIEEAETTWSFAYALKPSVTDKEGRVLLIQSLRRKNASQK